FVGAFAVQTYNNLPETFFVNANTPLEFENMNYLTVFENKKDVKIANSGENNSYNANIMLFNIIPLKTVRVVATDEKIVNVCGTPFGIKMFSDGVMVVGFSDIYTNTGYHNPAKTAGLALGDTIHTMNGVLMRTNEDVQKCVREAEGSPIYMEFTHKGERKTATITASKQAGSDELGYRLGMWVRDSSAGIGTLTMADYQKGVFAGLGHSISDIDTGETIELLSGEIVTVRVSGFTKSTAGSPGEMRGIFESETNGKIALNNENGVYGTLTGNGKSKFIGTQMPIAKMQEIKVGDAEIITTLDGETPQKYSVQIEKINFATDNPNKNMVIKITDNRLLSQTGGIIQGMSGSPIVQNGKLVGAVTHVLVSDPERGFAIFAENMYDTMSNIVKNNDKLQQNVA
ncbi:MAG: SpoIVB peptidase, partial [Oscillospiraceae bacterium]